MAELHGRAVPCGGGARDAFVFPRRTFVAATGAALLAATRPVRGQQQAEKVPRVGMFRLGAFPPSASEPFRQRLRELGYVEGADGVRRRTSSHTA